MLTTTGSGGRYFVSDPAGHDTEPNVWLRFNLTARDSSGQTHQVSRDVHPSTQLNTLSPVDTPANGWGPPERDMSNGEQAAGDGNVMMLGGVPYAHGWGVHAPSDMRFNLNGKCSGQFISHVGIDDEILGDGSVVFQVYRNGVLGYDSGPMTSNDPRRNIAVSVAGVNELRLVVTDGGNGNTSDHADWAAPRVTGCGTSSSTSNSDSSSSSSSSDRGQ